MNFMQGVYRKNRRTGNGVKAEVSVKNKVAYGVYGTNDDPAVKNAIVKEKFESRVADIKKNGEWDSIPNEQKVAMFQQLEAAGIPLSPELRADYDAAWDNFQNEMIMDAVARGDYSMLAQNGDYQPGMNDPEFLLASDQRRLNKGEKDARNLPNGRIPNYMKSDPRFNGAYQPGGLIEDQIGPATNRADALSGVFQLYDEAKQTVNNFGSYYATSANEQQALTNVVISQIQQAINSGNLSNIAPEQIRQRVNDFKFPDESSGSNVTNSEGNSFFFSRPSVYLKDMPVDAMLKMESPNAKNYQDHINNLTNSFFKADDLDKYYNSSRGVVDKLGISNRYTPITQKQYNILKDQQRQYYRKIQYKQNGNVNVK